MQITQFKTVLRKWWWFFLLLSLIFLFFANHRSPSEYSHQITLLVDDVLRINGINPYRGSIPMVTGTHYMKGKTVIFISEYEKIPPAVLIDIIKTIKLHDEKENKKEPIEVQLFKITHEEIAELYRNKTLFEEISPSFTILINTNEK